MLNIVAVARLLCLGLLVIVLVATSPSQLFFLYSCFWVFAVVAVAAVVWPDDAIFACFYNSCTSGIMTFVRGKLVLNVVFLKYRAFNVLPCFRLLWSLEQLFLVTLPLGMCEEIVEIPREICKIRSSN